VSQQPAFPVFCFKGQKVPYLASSFLPDIKLSWRTSHQWCAGSGFWCLIRPHIKNFLDLDWIGYRFHFNRIRNRIIQMKKLWQCQKT